jgi:hypothetical protein
MNPESPVFNESPISMDSQSPISTGSVIPGSGRFDAYQPPEFEIASTYPHDDPDLMDTGDSYQMRAILDSRLLVEKNKFDSFVQRCLTKCINDIAEKEIILPKDRKERDFMLMGVVARASEPSGFFGNVVFINVLTDILNNFRDNRNVQYCIETILAGYTTSVFEPASHYLIANINKDFTQICKYTCLLIVVRLLVDTFLGEYVAFGKARSNSLKKVKNDIRYLKLFL